MALKLLSRQEMSIRATSFPFDDRKSNRMTTLHVKAKIPTHFLFCGEIVVRRSTNMINSRPGDYWLFSFYFYG